MTEAEWASCNDPGQMLRFLRGRISDRQVRLFLVACCRGIFHVIEDERARAMVDVGERLAAGSATPAEIENVVRDFFAMHGEHHAECRVAVATCSPELSQTIEDVLDDMEEAVGDSVAGDLNQILADERARQCRVLRETVGNPFAPEFGNS
jgi:hypothetical protein